MGFAPRRSFNLVNFLTTSVLAALNAAIVAAGQTYCRSPAIYRDTIVFAPEDNIWRASISGGSVTRLTTPKLEGQALPPVGSYGKDIDGQLAPSR